MKKTLLLILIAGSFIFSSCKKDDPAPANPGVITLRYDFTADIVGAYDFTYKFNNDFAYDSANASNWSRTAIVTRPANSTLDSTSYTVFPPEAWINTSIQANATIKIFVNGVQKAENSGAIGGFDRPTGLTVKTTF